MVEGAAAAIISHVSGASLPLTIQLKPILRGGSSWQLQRNNQEGSLFVCVDVEAGGRTSIEAVAAFEEAILRGGFATLLSEGAAERQALRYAAATKALNGPASARSHLFI